MLKWTKTKSRNGSLIDASDIEEHFRKDYEESASLNDLEYVFGSPDRKYYHVRRKSTGNLVSQSREGISTIDLSSLRSGSSCLDLTAESEIEMKLNIENLENLQIVWEASENFHKSMEEIDEDKSQFNCGSRKNSITESTTETTDGIERFVNQHYEKNKSENVYELTISRFNQSDSASDDEVDSVGDCHDERCYNELQCYCCTEEDDDACSELKHEGDCTILCSDTHPDVDNVNHQDIDDSEEDQINNHQDDDNLDCDFKTKKEADSCNVSGKVTYNYSRDENSRDNVSSRKCEKSINHLTSKKYDKHLKRWLVRTNSKRKKWRRRAAIKLINTITTKEENEQPVVVMNFVHREKSSKDDIKAIEMLI